MRECGCLALQQPHSLIALPTTDIIAIKQHIMKTDKLKSPDIRKILINNTKIIYKNSNKNCLQILEAITIKNEKSLLWIKYHSPWV